MKETESTANLFYTWSNVDGDVATFNSWEEPLKNENFEYLENYRDSLDVFHAGKLIPITDIKHAKGKIYYKDNSGEFFSHNDESQDYEINQLYYGKVLVSCIPSHAEEQCTKVSPK